MLEGQCNCGAVRFVIEGSAGDAYVCHCSICRRWTGSNGVAVVVVPNGAFRWVQGESEVSRWQKPDADWQSSFCRRCGSALPGSNDPARMFVPVGLLPGDAVSRVAHHIWVDSKAAWDCIGDTGKRHPGAFGTGG